LFFFKIYYNLNIENEYNVERIGVHRMKRIIVIGSRRRNSKWDFDCVEETFLTIYNPGDIIVSGGCPKGGDSFAEDISARYNILMVVWKAQWTVNGVFRRWAGFERNTIIARNGDVVIACVADDRTGGTEDTIKKFKKFYPEGRVILC